MITNETERQRVGEAAGLALREGFEATMPDGTPVKDILGPLTVDDLRELEAYHRAEAARLNAEADQFEAGARQRS